MTYARVGRDRLVLAALLLFVSAPPLTAQVSDTVPLSVQEYIARLDEIISEIDQSTDAPSSQLSVLARDVPPLWRVETAQRTFDLPTDWLVDDLQSWRATRDATVRSRLAADVRMRRSEAALFEQPARDVAPQRLSLTDILSRPDFRNVHGPTWMDRLKQRALELMGAVLRPVLRSSAIPAVSRILVYGCIAVSVLVLGLWVHRSLRRDPAAHVVAAGLPSPSSIAWSTWLTEAEAAAARGRWREAIHLSYWCAISFLEAKGAWRPDPSRTPREYLQLLPPASEDRPALAALTRRFELVWYGFASADPQLFDEAMASLEQIGCPPVRP